MEDTGKKRNWWKTILPAGIVLILLCAGLFLFQVRTITVIGNERYSSEEISDSLLSDLLSHNTLYLLWKYHTGDSQEVFPYLSDLKLTMQSPSSLLVEVIEKQAAAYVLQEETAVLFDKDGMVLALSEEVPSDLMLITGVAMQAPTLYQKLPTDSSSQLRTILSLIQLLGYQQLEAEKISFGDNMDITIHLGQIQADLGQDEYLEEKIANLNAILSYLEGNAGILHMENFTGKNETITFTASDNLSESTVSSRGVESTVEISDQEAQADGEDTLSGQDTAGENIEDGDSASAEDSLDVSQEGQADEASYEEGLDVLTGLDFDNAEAGEEEPAQEEAGSTTFMVFNSEGTLVYDVHVENGQVVDSQGNPVDGCTINEEGNVVDAYWNEIDPATGNLLNG